MNRLDNIASSATPSDSAKYVEYTKHLGAGTLVELEYPAITVSNNPLVLTYGGSGTYGGFDRFGRVVDHKWQIDTAVKDRYTYGYDRGSNRLYRKNEVSASHSELSESGDSMLICRVKGRGLWCPGRAGQILSECAQFGGSSRRVATGHPQGTGIRE